VARQLAEAVIAASGHHRAEAGANQLAIDQVTGQVQRTSLIMGAEMDTPHPASQCAKLEWCLIKTSQRGVHNET
jgi:hypothetical protein